MADGLRRLQYTATSAAGGFGGVQCDAPNVSGCGNDDEPYGGGDERQQECRRDVDGDVRSGAMRQFFAGVDREWSGDYLYGAKHASESGYRDHNGDLSNRHHEDGVGNDYDYRLSGGHLCGVDSGTSDVAGCWRDD